MKAAYLRIETEGTDLTPVTGQTVGNSNRAVKITHTPTGLTAICGLASTQWQNRKCATEMLERGLQVLGWTE